MGSPPEVTVKKIPVACPRCGYTQLEPPTAYSTVCKKCQFHFEVQKSSRPAPKMEALAVDTRLIKCFQCGTELRVARTASSTMCKRCSSYVDLTDYRVTSTVSKSFRTHGKLVIEEKGYLLNTEAHVGDAVVKGKVIGKLIVEGTLELHSSAVITGKFSAGRLVIPQGHHFRWPQLLEMKVIEVLGELVCDVRVAEAVVLRASGKLFGNVEGTNFLVEAGAIFVGAARVGGIGRPQKLG